LPESHRYDPHRHAIVARASASCVLRGGFIVVNQAFDTKEGYCQVNLV